MDLAVTNDQLIDLAEKVRDARERLRGEQADHPAVADAGYALKSFAQWRSLDMPEAQRPPLGRELRSAAESCGHALKDGELLWLACEEAYDIAPARS